MSAQEDVRRPGRPREQRADRAILEAALEVLCEVGPTGLTVEEVAGRAGVGKATIYRRFAGKDELIVEALATLNESLPEVADGPVRDVLISLLDGWWERHDSSDAGRLFPRIAAHARSNPALFGCFFDRVIEPRRDLFRGVIRQGILAGELRPDTNVELMVTFLSATTLHHLQVRSGGRDIAPGSIPADFVDAVLVGFSAADRPSSSSVSRAND